MILSASQQIAAPQEFVLARAAEIDWVAQAARARGAEMEAPERTGSGTRCRLRVPLRGQVWPMALSIEAAPQPDALRVRVEAQPAVALASVRLVAAGIEATDATLRLELRPVGLQGRLLLGSLRMAQGRVQDRLHRDLAALARGAEALWRQSRG